MVWVGEGMAWHGTAPHLQPSKYFKYPAYAQSFSKKGQLNLSCPNSLPKHTQPTHHPAFCIEAPHRTTVLPACNIMAPGLIAPLPAEEPRQHHWDALQEDHASASSTAVSSSQASPRLHPTDAHARAKLGVSSGLDAAQGVDLQPLSGADLADEVKKEFQFSTEQCRRLEEILNKWERTLIVRRGLLDGADLTSVTAVKMPRGTRAYSESSIPTHTAEKRGSSTTPAENKTSRQRLYQATVEDCTESEDDESAPPSPRAAKASGSVEQAVAGGCPPLTFPASAPTSPVLKPALVTESSVPSTTSTAKEVRFSDRVPVVMQRRPSTRISSTRDNPERITGAHLAREISPSSLDKKWGKLFGDNGRPTERLEDVLRGLALYLVSSLEPLTRHHTLTNATGTSLQTDKLSRLDPREDVQILLQI